MDYLASSELANAIRDLGGLPAGDETSDTTRLLGHMNREQRVFLTKLMLSVREEYRVARVDVDLTPGTRTYRIPSRAIGAKLQALYLVDDGGGERLIHPRSPTALDKPGDYYLQDNQVVLVQSPSAGTLRFAYFRRLNQLVSAEEAGEISELDEDAGTVTLESVPSAFEATGTYDFIQSTPHFDTLAQDQSATLAGDVLTFADELPAELQVGDYVALKGETPVCQAPLELHDVLVYRTLMMVLTARGDPKAAAAKALLDELRTDAMSLLEPRVEDSPKPLVNLYGPGWRRRGRMRRLF